MTETVVILPWVASGAASLGPDWDAGKEPHLQRGLEAEAVGWQAVWSAWDPSDELRLRGLGGQRTVPSSRQDSDIDRWRDVDSGCIWK